MKNKIIYAVGICMIGFIIFFAVKTSGIIKKSNAKRKSSRTYLLFK
ncbi:hypothetical protein SAMN05216249_12814 [Acetitomaculum ruminis DSM 5522]|uniref:Uncharacterized protein n=1 Tax=Acetitomaculum ruminis DSM 5522 TaxID=1120918 RepID=A0A1I1AK16_9FIRM|nr:hypothetical protein SAMN05216249_12814 [Acetitomaculum ruminis DSM 5522]